MLVNIKERWLGVSYRGGRLRHGDFARADAKGATSMPDERTPILIGVGEASERIEAPDYQALSPADLAGRAAAAALADAGAAQPLAAQVDVIASLRQFETSNPKSIAPFGRSDNFPRAVARRI